MNDQVQTGIRRAHRSDILMTLVIVILGSVFLIAVMGLCAYIIGRGLASYYPGLMAFDSAGIGNQLWNSTYLVILTLVISCVVGIPAGIYMAEYAGDGPVARFIRISLETLSSLPSIVVGLFGYLVFIRQTGMSWNLMAGALTISILTIPLITTNTEDAFRSLPTSFLEGSMALGSTHWYAIRHVLLPAAFPRIITGIILAAGRAFGEATALMYTAGMSTFINWNQLNPTVRTSPFNPFRPGETLSLHIWTMSTEAIDPRATEIADFSSAILLIVALVFSLLARSLTRYFANKSQGKVKNSR